MIQKEYTFSGEDGFHARPVSIFVKTAKRFKSDIQIAYEGEIYDGKSALSVMSACIEDGCCFTLQIEGCDEQRAEQAILQTMTAQPEHFFVVNRPVNSKSAAVKMPSCGIDSPICVSSGFAIGTTLIYRKTIPDLKQQADDSQQELDAFYQALQAVKQDVEKNLQTVLDENAKGILQAHQEILNDTGFTNQIRLSILTNQYTCAFAIKTVGEAMSKTFEQLPSELMKERAADIRDIAVRLIEKNLGISNTLSIDAPHTILVAQELLPSDTMQLNCDLIDGIITQKGGRNCHSAIIARSMGIPALSNVSDAVTQIPNHTPIILDADHQTYFLNPDKELLQSYQDKAEAQKQEQLLDQQYLYGKTRTLDGHETELFANLINTSQITSIAKQGAQGVGLFRTEFLYLDREQPPSFEEQLSCYQTLLIGAQNMPTIIRTLDAGGDKPATCLSMPKEDNPFLGVRAIRYCLRHPDIFRIQLRALLTASAYGNLKIMFPMISCIHELQEALKLLKSEEADLRQHGVTIGAYQVGMMVETPAAAMMSEEFASMVDFFSIGTNDLTQYIMAADRQSAQLTELQSAYQPAVLRCIYHVAKSALHHKIPIGVCGESGADPLLTPFFIGCGVNELSMSAGKIASIRRRIASLSYTECQDLVLRVLACHSEDAVRSLLWQFHGKSLNA